MGCDIHLYVEKQNELGVWESVDEFRSEERRVGKECIYRW